jgi:hypothetical protein
MILSIKGWDVMNSDDPVLEQMLMQELTRLQVRRQYLEDQARLLQEEIGAVVRRMTHVQALLQERIADSVEIATDAEEPKMPAQPRLADGFDPVEIAFKILNEKGGEPIYYKELAATVLQNGGELNGADPAMTLVSRLVTDERFVRPFRRGWYALRVHHPRAKNVGGRKKPAKRRSERIEAKK